MNIKNDVHHIIFYGPLNERKIGGGESGNLKTIFLLEKNGFTVKRIYKPYPQKNLFGFSFLYGIQLFYKIIHITMIFIFFKNVKKIHISGFYNHLIYQEYLLIIISRLFKKKCIYELRAGGVISSYVNRSPVYRCFFRNALNNASIILCQGKSFIPFVKSLTKVKVLHYPNYILNDFLPDTLNNNRHKNSTVHLIYFGRITNSKNLELTLSICRELKSSNFIFDLEIIGSGETEYIKCLKSIIDHYDIGDFIKIKDPISENKLKEKLSSKHFFLFPSKEPREGHSNALTEAMAFGVVPICSNAGFNSEIVGNDNLIIDNYNLKSYANKIKDIWKNGYWIDFSKQASNRVATHYTEKIAEKALLEAYELQ